jgi:hypothetical protein
VSSKNDNGSTRSASFLGESSFKNKQEEEEEPAGSNDDMMMPHPPRKWRQTLLDCIDQDDAWGLDALCRERPRLTGVYADELMRRALMRTNAFAMLRALAECAPSPMRLMFWLLARGRTRAASVFAFACSPGRAVYALRHTFRPKNAVARREALGVAGAIALRQRLLHKLLVSFGVPPELYLRLGVVDAPPP